MKKCMNCNINVGGDAEQCPLCQNGLIGEATENVWPHMGKLRIRSLFYKIQLFLVLGSSAVVLALDFLLSVNEVKHWSLIYALWGVSIELLIRHFLKKSIVPAAIITETSIHITVLLGITGWYLDFISPVLMYVVPGVITGLLVINLILALIDKRGNAMVYLLSNIVIGIVPYIVLMIIGIEIPVIWTVCLMVSVVTFIGISIFKGRTMINEIQKRMSI